MRVAKASCNMTSWYTVVKILREYDWLLEKMWMGSQKDTRISGKDGNHQDITWRPKLANWLEVAQLAETKREELEEQISNNRFEE